MTITIELDDALERQLRHDFGDLSKAAKEALLIEAYRRGNVSLGRLAMSLGMGVLEAEQWLGRRDIGPGYGLREFQDDCHTLDTRIDDPKP